MEWKNISVTWKKVFTNWRYLALMLVVAFVFYLINVTISSWKSLIGFYSTLGLFNTVKFFLILFLGFKETIQFSSFVSLITISLLLGMLVSLIGYKLYIGILSFTIIKVTNEMYKCKVKNYTLNHKT